MIFTQKVYYISIVVSVMMHSAIIGLAIDLGLKATRQASININNGMLFRFIEERRAELLINNRLAQALRRPYIANDQAINVQ